jgi:uncharacterized protein YggE
MSFPAYRIAAILGTLMIATSGAPSHAQGQSQAQAVVINQSPAQGQSEGREARDADSQNVENHIITVSRGGDAYAKPDLGILVMSIQSTSPIADEAVSQNADKAQAVESALAGLGIAPDGYEITSVTFGQAGAGMPRFPGPAEITGYTTTQDIYVFFEGADLSDVAVLTKKTASVIEALRKAGAMPANAVPGIMIPMAQGALIIYTIKDPTPYEHQALQLAIARVRDAAQDLAAGLGVQITGLRSAESSYLSGSVMPKTGSSPLVGLDYRWYSTKSDELDIHANATVQYDFK